MKEFSERRIKNSYNIRTREYSLYRYIFSRWLIENGYKISEVSTFLGAPKNYASKARRELIRSTNPKHKEMWQRWKNFMSKDEENVE